MNIIVTGTSRGIGKELVEILSANHNVIALSRSLGRLSLNNNITYIPFDFDKIDNHEFENKLKEWGRVDILINNAGHLVNKPFLEITLEEIQEMCNVNFVGPYRLIQKCIPYMYGETKHVVNISSVGGVQGSVKFAGLSGYSSSKGALGVLTECLAEELKEKGVKVNTLALGAVQTEMLEQAFPGYKAPISAFDMAKYIADFAISHHQYYNGKIISVSTSTP
jgi:3-oxoacyl-[acyl-carrier protein] reductase